MEHDTLHGQIFDAVCDPLVVIDGRGNVHVANAAALRLFDLGTVKEAPARPRSARLDLNVAALAELVRRRQRLHGVPLPDRTGRDTGVVVDIDPGVGPPDHALLHFRACTDALARELWTDDAVATVAHEFRNPLSGMRSALHVLSSGDAGTITENQRRFIDAVQRGVGRLSRIVDGYLDLGRVRAGVFATDRAEHDVRGVIFGITGDLALCHPALASRIDVAIEPHVGNAFVDPDRIAQVLLNLVYNAARFTPDSGRLALRVKPAGREALDDPLRLAPFEVLGEPKLVCIEVEDEGIGMSSDVLAHVFDRYHGDPRDPARAGAHLGLHIARSLVDAHDGWIRMESRLGEGTTASVFLPASAATARLLSRLRGAEDAMQRLRVARRPVTLALIADEAIRDGETAPAGWPKDWAINPVRRSETTAPALVWLIRSGVALLVTTHGAAFAEGGLEQLLDSAAGTCRAENGITFSGALRTAAANLLDSMEHRAVRAELGVETVRE